MLVNIESVASSDFTVDIRKAVAIRRVIGDTDKMTFKRRDVKVEVSAFETEKSLLRKIQEQQYSNRLKVEKDESYGKANKCT